MLSDHWPLLGLRVRTSRLELRPPTEDDLAALADVAAQGIHEPGRSPFLNSWADRTPAERAQEFLRRHWRHLGSWSPSDWALGLAVFESGRPVGMQHAHAKEFAVLGEVLTGSWLGREFQGRGIGTEMRSAVLHLAFAGLDAAYAVSETFADNPAALAISRKLGYRADGVARYAVDGNARMSERFRMSRAQWEATDRPQVTIAGLDPCLAMFGIERGRARA
ncbi:GNAT family N-acetyltransferase [Spongiactinospora sp. 9N601]|uniref:GNAT family N-acetyltransferase n=1 Tax=Spongiactinospora sp. 9N601 TaxID=3375149 RepID=UPI0037A74567